MQRILQNLAALAAAVALLIPGALKGATASIDSNVTNQSIRGFGVSSAWCGAATIAPAAAEIWADDNTDGHAGLSILRTRIDPTGNFANEAAPMTQARAQNPNVLIWSTEWTPPAAYKNNNSVNGPGATNTFNNTPANSTAYANYLINYIKTIKSSYGIDLYAVSPQNEPDWDTSYESCLWTATQFNDFTKTYLYPAIQSNALPTKIMIPESFSDNLAMAATAMNDAVTAPMVSIIGNHIYGGGPRPLSAGGWAHLTNQESWETEMSDVSGAPHDPGMVSALQIANWIHGCMVTASMNAYLHWWIYSFNGSNEGLYGANCTTPTKKLSAMGNFSKFVRPGWYRMGGVINSNNAGVNISAYKNVAGAPGKFAIVAINTNTSPVVQSFSFSNFNAVSVTPWITDSSRSLVRQAAVVVSGGSFSFSLPAQSLVSFVGSCPPVGSPTFTATATPTHSSTLTATLTRSTTPTFTPTVTRSNTLTFTSTLTPSFSSTPSSTLTFSGTPTPSSTGSSTKVPSSTLSVSPSFTQTRLSSATSTSTPTVTPSATTSQTLVASRSFTPSFQATDSVTITANPTLANSYTATATVTSSPSPSFSRTTTPSSTASPSASPQSSATPSTTATLTMILPSLTPAPLTNGKLYVLPNPVNGDFVTLYPPYFLGVVDGVVQVFSVSYVKLVQIEFKDSTWHPLRISLHEQWGGRLPRGLYYVVFKAPGIRAITKMLVIS